MISLFDLSFPRVSLHRDSGLGGEGLLMGMVINGTEPIGLVILEDGGLSLVHASHFTLAYRYDVENDKWVDPTEPVRVVETDEDV